MEIRWNRLYLSREELYDMVWSEPAIKVGKRLGVSDVAISKLCKRLNVPKPPLGYWAKLASGKSSAKKLLPKRENLPQLGSLPYRPPRSEDEAEASVSHAQAIFEKGNVIEVPPALSDPDPLILNLQKALSSAKVGSDGYIRHRKQRLPSVPVTPETKDRALLILDALLKALRYRQLEVKLSAQLEAQTPFGPVSFLIEEYTQKIDREPTASELQNEAMIRRWRKDYVSPRYTKDIPSGFLALRITSEALVPTRRTWRGSEKRPLEKLLNGFIVGLIRFAEQRSIEIRRREEEEIRREQERREWAEAEENRRVEKAKREALWTAVGRREKAEQLHRFAQALESKALSGDLMNAITRQYLDWVHAYADELDPLANPEGQFWRGLREDAT